MPNHFCTTDKIEGQTKAILKTHVQKPIPIALLVNNDQHGTE